MLHCDTIFYQGANSTQTQALHYTGKQKIKATTGQIMSCSGRNNLKPLNVIFNLFIGTEIADVNLQPYATYADYFNPLLRIYTNISWGKNYLTGVKIEPGENPTSESVEFHGPNLAKMSYGQDSDIESHHKKYELWKENKKNEGLILYGVSRGTAATFCAFAKYHYPEVKLVILEGAVDSVENVAKTIARNLLRNERLANAAFSGFMSSVEYLNRNGMFGYNRNGVSPLSVVDEFPENVPVVFVTSKKDTVVYPENTKNIAEALNRRGKNDVYLLELNNSRHPAYMYDDENDRNTYEAFINAIYKRYALQYDEQLAQKGESFVESCLLQRPRIQANNIN